MINRKKDIDKTPTAEPLWFGRERTGLTNLLHGVRAQPNDAAWDLPTPKVFSRSLAPIVGAKDIHLISFRARCDLLVRLEGICQPFYAERLGRPSMMPGMYFRLLMVGYFEGIDSERGIACGGRQTRWESARFCKLH